MLAYATTLAAVDDSATFLVFMGGSIAITIISISAVYYHQKNKLFERSRQEIAAYIAEGSMTPEDGERLLNAGGDKRHT